MFKLESKIQIKFNVSHKKYTDNYIYVEDDIGMHASLVAKDAVQFIDSLTKRYQKI